MYLPPAPCLGGLLLGGVTGGLPGSGPPATPLTCPAGVEVRSVSAPWRAAEEGNSMLRRLGVGVGLVGGGTGGPGAAAPGSTDATPAGAGSVIRGSRLACYSRLVNYTS